jgi:hypothetical protein
MNEVEIEVSLTSAHRLEIAETLVGREVEFDRVYRALEDAVLRFREAGWNHEFFPPKRTRDRWRRIDKLAADLNAELMLSVLETLNDADLREKFHALIIEQQSCIAALKKMRRQANLYVDMLDTRGHVRYRQSLYNDVLQVWTGIVGGELKYSRPKGGGEPNGPLIRFFAACLAPILGDQMPSPRGIADIIDRARSGGLAKMALPL